MGGFDSTVCTALSALENQSLLACTVPCTTTLSVPPALMVMSPEPVVTSRLTVPETVNVRSKWPSARACSSAGANRRARKTAVQCFLILPRPNVEVTALQEIGLPLPAAQGGGKSRSVPAPPAKKGEKKNRQCSVF